MLKTRKDPARSRFISKSFNSELENDLNSTAAAPSLRAFLIQPFTGKKHQLRVMLKSLQSPALGDPLYATKDDYEKAASDRCYLHACGMRIAMPNSMEINENYLQVICI